MDDRREITFSVLIASIGRDSLRRTVVSVIAAGESSGAAFEIVIADDSGSGRVREVLANGAVADPRITVVEAGARNIALARNLCVDHSSGALIAFVDDDEWVRPDWLRALERALRESGADAVFGPVRARYPAGANRLVAWGDPFSKSPGDHGAPVRYTSTANCLVRRDVFFGRDLRFKPELGRSGGEDADLFGRLQQGGGKLVAAPDAWIEEEIELARCRPADLWRRSLGKGQTYARRKMRRDLRSRTSFLLGALLRVALLSGASLSMLLCGRRSGVRLLVRSWVNVGKAREALNLPMILYY